jgi:integrase/recombinase XerD
MVCRLIAIAPYGEIELLFNDGLQTDRDRALFGICLYAACRVAEACSLKVIDVFTPTNAVMQ